MAQYDPEGSGYADDQGMNAVQAATDDLNALFGTISENNLWVTRLNAELGRPALATDLQLGAAVSQSTVERYFYVQNTTGTAPSCPVYDPCPPDTNLPGEAGGWNFWGSGGTGGAASAGSTTSACAMTTGGGAPMFGGLAIVAALGLARRRRTRRA